MAVRVRRLLKRQDFLRLKSLGGRVSTQAFVLQWLDVPEEDGLGVGFTASGALGGAVKRNRARRRLKAAFDEACRCNPECRFAGEAKGRWLVMVAKMPMFEIDYTYLMKDMRKALAEAGLVC
ncbi:MAG: ribonuclease P protein component [Alphaproteobacteria bacterium]|nr:MAG: ribonuclease P protein component [Alphaproteobacteria bacterium]